MKSFVIAAICVAFFSISTVTSAATRKQCTEGQVLYDADLKTGKAFIHENPKTDSESDDFMIKSQVGLLQPDDAAGECNWQGVLKITFPKADNNVQKSMLRFDLQFNTPSVSGYAFHVGDSLTNRGIGGDDGINVTPYIGEAFSWGQTWIVHTNDLTDHTTAAISDPPYVVVEESSYITNDVTVFIGDEYISSINDLGIKREFKNKYMPAALRGQGPDYDIAVGMNRLIDGNDVAGAGLCHITITACDAVPSDVKN